MKIVKAYLFVFFILSILIGPGCSDNGNDSNNDIPANLADTWWLQSATINGEPLTSMYIYCHLGEPVTFLSLVLRADGTWDVNGYRENMTLIGTQTGTFTVSGDDIILRMTACDDEPVEEPAQEDMIMQFSISGNTLTLTQINDDPYIVAVQIYTRD